MEEKVENLYIRDKEKYKEGLRAQQEKKSRVDALYNLYDGGDYYILEIMLPGAKKEEISIQYVRSSHSIEVVYSPVCVDDPDRIEKPLFVQYSPRERSMNRYKLPDDTRPDVVTADFASGILMLHIGKGNPCVPIPLT